MDIGSQCSNPQSLTQPMVECEFCVSFPSPQLHWVHVTKRLTLEQGNTRLRRYRQAVRPRGKRHGYGSIRVRIITSRSCPPNYGAHTLNPLSGTREARRKHSNHAKTIATACRGPETQMGKFPPNGSMAYRLRASIISCGRISTFWSCAYPSRATRTASSRMTNSNCSARRRRW